MTMLTRRAAIAVTGASLLPLPALALDAGAAQRHVEGLVAEVNAVIASNPSEPRMISAFADILKRYADVPTIARYCLGADARTASSAEISAYTNAFLGYIASKYGRRFREFIGGQIVVKGARPVKSWIEVESTVILRNRSPFRMDWHVSDRSGWLAFFNFIIEGVNMLLTERAEIGAMLDRNRGSMAGLIKDMKNI